MNQWSFGTSASVLLLGIALWLVAGFLSYLNWQRNGRRPRVAALELLRFTLITLLTLTLLRPEFIQRIQRTTTPVVAVLADASRSMETRDIVRSNAVLSRAQWLQDERKQQFWKPIEKAAKVSLQTFSAPQPHSNATNAPDHGTDLSTALDDVLQHEKNLRAVLLLTDGDWNTGKSPLGTATRYREQGIPVFAVSVGRQTPVPDLAVESVTPPAYGLFGEQISIPFTLQNNLPHEVKTTVFLFEGDRTESKKEMVLPPMTQSQDVILWSPRSVGEKSLTLKIPVEPDEALPENNTKDFRISVRVDVLRVLVVDSLPRWEYRYLRNALERDPGVEMNCLLYHPGLGTGAGRQYLASFPGSKETLSRYDVIFLGDVGIGNNELTEKDAQLIKGLVEQQASGLVFVPGRRGRHLTWVNSPLKELLPVVLQSSKEQGVPLQNEANLLLSSTGAGHWLTRFDADESRNREVWKQLPGFFWSAAVDKSRPGSEVLAVHSSLRNSWGRMPLLVTRPFGSGKVLFLGTDSAWRWRRGVEDKFHYRFWSQVVRWMAHQRHLSEKDGIRLSYSPEVPQAGDTVFLQTTILDSAGFPIEHGPVSGRVSTPAGRTERLEFTPGEKGWGVFKSSFSAQEGGPHSVEIAADQHGRKLNTQIVINRPVREKLGRPVNSEVLAEIAGISRGASAQYDQLQEVVRQITVLPEPKPLQRRIRLWANPWWGGVILLFLGIYWTGRKLAGMV